MNVNRTDLFINQVPFTLDLPLPGVIKHLCFVFKEVKDE
jgi:hypothetical protein